MVKTKVRLKHNIVFLTIICVMLNVVVVSEVSAVVTIEAEILSPDITAAAESFQSTYMQMTHIFQKRVLIEGTSKQKGLTPERIKVAEQEGRLFFLGNREIFRKIFDIRDETAEEVAGLFLNDQEKETPQGKLLINRLQDEKFRKKLFYAFWLIKEKLTFFHEIVNFDVAVIVESPDAPTYLFGPQAQNIEKELEIEDLFHYEGKNTMYFSFNMLRESRINDQVVSILLSIINNSVKNKTAATIDAALGSEIITEDDRLLLDEFINEFSGISYRKVKERGENISTEKVMSVAEVDKNLCKMFDIEKKLYTIGDFKIEYDRFSSKGKVRVGSQMHDYYSIDYREYFYRAGDIFVVDSSYKKFIPKEMFYSEAKFIFVDFRDQLMNYSIDSGARSGNYRNGTIGQLLAMQHMDLKDKVVVDAGTGNGIIGIAAAILGAKKVIMLEAHESYQELVAVNAEINGVLDKMDFSYFGKTIQQVSEYFQKENKEIPVDLIFANIPWWGLPKKVDRNNFADNLVKMLLASFPAKLYIAAGDEYINSSKGKTEAEFRSIDLKLEEAVEIITNRTFGDIAPTLIFSYQQVPKFEGPFAQLLQAKAMEKQYKLPKPVLRNRNVFSPDFLQIIEKAI